MRAQLTDIVMAYDEAGSGPPLLLIHGYPLSRKLWAPQLAALGDAARVIAPDLRGFGESDAPKAPYTMDQLADDCVALLDSLEVTEPVVVGGLSMGGYIALAFWRRHAARVAGGEGETVFETGELRVDLAARLAYRRGEEVRLTRTEYRLLAALVKHAGKVLTHRQLLVEVWGPGSASETHYLRVYMAQLRHKLEDDPARPRHLLTETGVGYRLRAD